MYALATIMGRLGGNPEPYKNKGNRPFTVFSVATNYTAGESDEVTWWRCVAWGQTANAVATMAKKGSLVFLTGRPRLKKYTVEEKDRNGAIVKVEKERLEVVVEDFRMAGGRPGGRARGTGSNKAKE